MHRDSNCRLWPQDWIEWGWQWADLVGPLWTLSKPWRIVAKRCIFLLFCSDVRRSGVNMMIDRFDKVRIPRENLLNAVADVTPDGRYESAIKDPDQVLNSYFVPIIVKDCQNWLLCWLLLGQYQIRQLSVATSRFWRSESSAERWVTALLRGPPLKELLFNTYNRSACPPL